MTKLEQLLKTAGYGTLLRVGREIWMKCAGLDGPIMQCADGHWHFIDNSPRWTPLHIRWKRRKIEVLFREK